MLKPSAPQPLRSKLRASLGPTSSTAVQRTRSTGHLPAWPVIALLWGLPLWWLVGLFPLSTVIMAVPMVLYLLQYRHIALPPGFMPYLALLVWILPTAMMLDGGILGFVIRFSQLASVGVVAAYVLNARESLPWKRLLSGVCIVWGWVVLGGYLGLFSPDLELTWTVGRLLPAALTANTYVSDLVFPTPAEVQTPWGAEEPFVRPSAPFAYANGWGASIGLLTPVVVARAAVSRHRWRYVVLGGALLIALPPALASTNRGLFLALGIVVVYVVLRLFLRGNAVALLTATCAGAILALSGAWSRLSQILGQRQEVVDTTEGRSRLYWETWERAWESPILGHGSSRPSLTTEVTLGTHGMVWSMMFCFGFVGLVLFVWFLGGLVCRTIAVPTTAGLWLHAALVAALIMSTFYGLDRHLPYIVLIGALLLRDKHRPEGMLWPAR